MIAVCEVDKVRQRIALAAVRQACGENPFFKNAIAEIMAFAQIESSFNPMAYRFEPRLDEASYGILQILKSDARDRGFTGSDFTSLFLLPVGLRYGMAQIQWTQEYLSAHKEGFAAFWNGEKYPDAEWQLIAAAYNAGVGNVCHGFKNPKYVARWIAARDYWAAEIVRSDGTAA